MADDSNEPRGGGLLDMVANLVAMMGFGAILVAGFWFIGELDGCIYVSIPG